MTVEFMRKLPQRETLLWAGREKTYITYSIWYMVYNYIYMHCEICICHGRNMMKIHAVCGFCPSQVPEIRCGDPKGWRIW